MKKLTLPDRFVWPRWRTISALVLVFIIGIVFPLEASMIGGLVRIGLKFEITTKGCVPHPARRIQIFDGSDTIQNSIGIPNGLQFRVADNTPIGYMSGERDSAFQYAASSRELRNAWLVVRWPLGEASSRWKKQGDKIDGVNDCFCIADIDYIQPHREGGAALQPPQVLLPINGRNPDVFEPKRRSMRRVEFIPSQTDLPVYTASHQKGAQSEQKGEYRERVRPLLPRAFSLVLIAAAGFGWWLGGVIYK